MVRLSACYLRLSEETLARVLALAVSYDCDDPPSFKSICLKCNNARPLFRPITGCM